MKEIILKVTQSYELLVAVTPDADEQDIDRLRRKASICGSLDGIKRMLDDYEKHSEKDIVVEYGDFEPINGSIKVEIIKDEKTA